ncbi:hypothetical protein [Nonomuraea helvata]|uniref:Uncharacterized protein n=1 Tax=Nonomuraea helvata TaxID=37484 RepID=A0ABV5SBH5_9ACTN
MGKFDGMDPKLVRDLLAEVKHAATQLRAAEDRVRLAMHRAGLSAVTTHRPAQVADSADTMVKDVNVRLGVLEKRVDRPRGDEPKDVRGDQNKYDNPRSDGTPPKNDDTKTGEETRTGDGPKADADGKTGDRPKADADGKTGDRPKADADGKTGDRPKADADGKTGDQPKADADGKTDADGDGKTCDGAKDTGTGQDTGADQDAGTDRRTGDQSVDLPTDQPKDDALDSRRDRGAEADGGATTGTPAQDHQDVTKPQIVEVDGVKVLQIPIDPPTAEQLEDLLENADKVQPADMPHLPADTATTHTADVNAWANDGSDVVSAGTDPPGPDALKTVVGHHREIPPLDMPGLSETSGHDTTPTDGTAPTAGTNDDACASNGDTTPGSTAPDSPSGDGAGQDGAGQDGAGQGGAGQKDGQTTGGRGAPVSVPPTNPSIQMQIAYGRDTAASNVAAWANDGSDVVSVDVTPPSLDALGTVVEHHRDIQPLDMPSVEVPPGEYGRGEWAPRDIRPDGPQGEIDPGTPERSA